MKVLAAGTAYLSAACDPSAHQARAVRRQHHGQRRPSAREVCMSIVRIYSLKCGSYGWQARRLRGGQ